MTIRACSCALALVGLLFAAVRPAMADRSPHGRVSSVDGDLLVKGPDDSDWSYLERNAVVHDDDVVWSDEESLAEIEMERGAWLRLGPDTRVDLRRLPPAGEVRLKRGSVYVDLSDATEEGVRVATPSGEVAVEAGSLARIDLDRDDRVRVFVRRGRAEVELEQGEPRRARAGEMLVLRPDERRARLLELDRKEFDAFDDWCDDRVAYYMDHRLPPGVNCYIPGVYELAEHGEWVEDDGVRCWRPRHVDDDWRPYRDGYWASWHGEPVWVAAEPWGYTTCHYGRWRWTRRYGWVWQPGYVWGPAWVRWARQDDYVLWVPLDPDDRPCYRYPPRAVGGVLIDLHACSCMPRENFVRRDRTVIVVAERAPVIQVTRIQVVREAKVIYRELPPAACVRGVQRTAVATEAPGARLRVLENQPRRPEFRITEFRRPTVSIPAAGPGAAPQTPVTSREETRALVRRQVSVPALRVNQGGPPAATPTSGQRGSSGATTERPAAATPGRGSGPAAHPTQTDERPASDRRLPRATGDTPAARSGPEGDSRPGTATRPAAGSRPGDRDGPDGSARRATPEHAEGGSRAEGARREGEDPSRPALRRSPAERSEGNDAARRGLERESPARGDDATSHTARPARQPETGHTDRPVGSNSERREGEGETGRPAARPGPERRPDSSPGARPAPRSDRERGPAAATGRERAAARKKGESRGDRKKDEEKDREGKHSGSGDR
jgi:hypothetical protein